MDKNVYIHTCPKCHKRFWHTECEGTTQGRNPYNTPCKDCGENPWEILGMGTFFWCDEFKDWALEVRRKAGLISE